MRNAKFALFVMLALVAPFKSHIARADNAPLIPDVLAQYVASNKEFKNFIFYSLIAKRCSHFLPQQDIPSCRSAVSKMIELLDTDIVFPEDLMELAPPGKFLFVAFKNSLIDLLNQKSTERYLASLNEEMSQFMVGQIHHFNLWDFTLQYFHSTEKASMVIASLFQDTSSKKLHLEFLSHGHISRGQNFKINKELLNRTIDTLNLMLDYNESNFHELLFPIGTKKDLNRSLYHFYVPLYLSMELQKRGVQKKMAFTAPLLMTLTYEFITTANDYRYLLKDPETIRSEWKVRDIFAGLQGAAFGIEKKDIKSIEFLRTGFLQSTQKTVRALLLSSP